MKMKTIITDKYHGYRHQEVCLTPTNTTCKLIIHPDTTYQTIQGFGGAFTESACYNLTRVNPALKKQALEAYFSKTGLKYNLGRIHMNGCDFSLSSYNYVEDYDTSLTSFDIKRDQKMIIPTIKEAENIANQTIELIVSPWSPCWWMKDNLSEVRGGHLKKEYYQIWANYFVKYLQALKKLDISVFGVTVQNEPAAAQRWDSCLYSPEEERDFLKVLGKTFEEQQMHPQIYIWDHNRDIMNERVKPIFDDPIASKYAYGVAIHWYDNEPFSNLAICKKNYPDKHIISTESCIECGPKFNVYETGERYGRNIIGNFINGCEAFIDWNLFLDETGGPNWVNNLCDAPVMILVNEEKIVKQSSYYYIGHFSKYIQKGAKRIESINSNEAIQTISFINPNQQIVTILMNTTENDYDYEIQIKQKSFKTTLLKRSIMTIIEGDENE